MKLKLILLAAIILMTGTTVVVLLFQPHGQTNSAGSPARSPLPSALSNYNQTFKLNTQPPLWPATQNSGGTNGLTPK